ncbi:102_t:CDS:2, partial [Gigaspora rosea]
MDSLYNDESNSLPNSNEERNSSGSEILDSTPASTSTNLPVNSVKKKTKRKPYLWQDSTSNLITHLRDIHNLTKESLANKSKIKVQQQTIQQVIMKPHSSYIQEKLTHQVVHYIVSRAQPIYLVEIDDFRLLIKSFDSRFKMPCVNTIKTIIFDTYTLATNQIIDLISKSSDTVSLTFDIWSSRAYDSYLRITCHWLTDSFELHEIVLEIRELDDHYAIDIVESVNSVLDKFSINHQKIFSITTDNGSNIKSAVQQLGVTNVKCAGHTLQLSKKKRRQLREAQLQIAPGLKEPLDVIKDVDTRWNSTFYSIKRLVHLKSAIMQLYSTLNNHTLREVRKGAETMGSFLPLEEEFESLEELIMVLSPFDEATQFLSGSKYPTLGFMTPMLEELARQLKHFTGQNDEVIFVKDTILDNLIERWEDPSEIGMCCSFLDPRFKQLNFCTSDLHRTTIQTKRRQFNELQTTNDTIQTNNDDNTISTSHQHKKRKLLTFYSYSRSEYSNAMPDKFDRYCEIPE